MCTLQVSQQSRALGGSGGGAQEGDLGGSGCVTIAVYRAMRTRLLAIALDLFTAALVACPRHPTAFLERHARGLSEVILHSGSIFRLWLDGTLSGRSGALGPGHKLVQRQIRRLLVGHIVGAVPGAHGPRLEGGFPRAAPSPASTRRARSWPNRAGGRRAVSSRACHGRLWW
jgi:hypothetical protein